MILQAPLSTITPTVDGDILSALAEVDAWFTITRLHGMIPQRSREGIRRAVSRLVEQGVVDSHAVGTTYSYRLNRDHLAAPSITALASIRTALFDRLRGELDEWDPSPIFAAIFGSAARGVMSTSSDIDLFLLHPARDVSSWDSAVDGLAHRARRWTGNTMNALVMNTEEVQGAVATEPVLQDIAAEALPLRGELGSFKRLIGAAR